MKSKSLKYLQNKGFKLYPKDGKFNVYLNNQWYADGMTEREILKAAKTIRKPATKPRKACNTPRPGCPCCDVSKSIVKKFDKKAQRRFNKRIEIEE